MRYYSSTVGEMTLQAGISGSDTSISVDTTSGLPVTFPYALVIDYGSASEEIVDVTNASGTTLTVTRAADGTIAQAHAFGATIRHVATARDFREAREHEAASSGVHGATGPVVGTTDTQALTNKDLSSATNTFPSTLATDAEVTAAVAAHEADTTTHGVTGAVVGTTDTQTLTNKTVTGGTVNPTTLQKASVNVPTISETATLTNKTMSGSSNTFSNIPQSAVTSLTTDLAALDTRLDSIEAAATAFTPVAQDGSGTVATSTGGIGYWTKIGKVVHVVGSLTLTEGIVGSASVGLPAAAGTPVFRHLNAGTLWVIGPSAPALTGIATMQTDLLRVTATADTGGFRGASSGDALRFNLTYLVS